MIVKNMQNMKYLKLYENFFGKKIKQYRDYPISEAPMQEFMEGELVRRKTDGEIGSVVGFEKEYKEEGDIYFSFMVEFEGEEPKKYFANELEELSEREEQMYKLRSI